MTNIIDHKTSQTRPASNYSELEIIGLRHFFVPSSMHAITFPLCPLVRLRKWHEHYYFTFFAQLHYKTTSTTMRAQIMITKRPSFNRLAEVKHCEQRPRFSGQRRWKELQSHFRRLRAVDDRALLWYFLLTKITRIFLLLWSPFFGSGEAIDFSNRLRKSIYIHRNPSRGSRASSFFSPEKKEWREERIGNMDVKMSGTRQQ